MRSTQSDISMLFFVMAPLVVVAGYFLIIRMKKAYLLKKTQNSPLPKIYETMLEHFIPYHYLNADEQKKFKSKLYYFLEDKIFNGVGDLVVTDEMKFLVAAEACLMITNINGDVYPDLKNVYLVEDVFIPKDNPVNTHTGLPTHVARSGEAWKRGPIVLSWASIKQGSSVIFHEFSHQLDQQDGDFDGTPKLGKTGSYDQWAQVMGEEFLQLRHQVEAFRGSDIDSYGATNEAEFFAVITEYFYTRPMDLKDKHPKLFEIYRDYFKLDPSKWNKR